MEETRPGEYLPVEEDERGTYIFNSKDLCMIEHIPELVDAGIYSFKIEGRMKTNLYVAVAARTYREAIDDYLESPELYKSKIDHYKKEISDCTMRNFSTGFYFGKPSQDGQIYDSNTYFQNAIYLGLVEDVVSQDEDSATVMIHQKNKFLVGEEIEVMLFDGRNLKCKVAGICDEDGNSMESAPHPKQKIFIALEKCEQGDITQGMILRNRKN